MTLNRSLSEVPADDADDAAEGGGAQGGERGRGASSWVGCRVGATVRAYPQTAVAALPGLESESGGKSGALERSLWAAARGAGEVGDTAFERRRRSGPGGG